jgi:hypothetical protein
VAIYVQPGATYEAAAVGLLPNLPPGTAGVTLKDKPAGGVVVQTRVTAGITEDPIGSRQYGKSDLVAPTLFGSYWLHWDSGPNTPPFALEELVVSSSLLLPGAEPLGVIPTYAQRSDCLAFIEGLNITDGLAFDRLIVRCERQIDDLLQIDHRTTGAAGPKVTPNRLSARQAEGLKNATCAQVEYRLEMGERFFKREQYESESGPDFSVRGRLPKIGPKVVPELVRVGLFKITAPIA